MTRNLWVLAALSLAGFYAGQAAPLRPGRNTVPVRGVAQDVYCYPGGTRTSERPCVLFAPGDGGWRGFAVTVAEETASWGYDVYALDTKKYLESFTGNTTLREADVTADVRAAADAVRGQRRVALVGWSEGAGLMALAAVGPSKAVYAGLVTIELGDRNVLGWRFADNLTYLTRKPPNEPTFSALSHMAAIAPIPLAMLQSSRDEYVTRDEANRLFLAAAEPKRFVLVEAQNHRFDGARAEFFLRLREALQWTTEAGTKPRP